MSTDSGSTVHCRDGRASPAIAFLHVGGGKGSRRAGPPSARQALVEYSAQLPGSRVLEDRYGANRPAVVVAKGQAARLAYISEFIEEIKASGFVQQAITRSGWRGVQVAPPASPTVQK